MSTPSVKRRRLEDAQSTLRKPFRPPLTSPRRMVEPGETHKMEMTANSAAVPRAVGPKARSGSSANECSVGTLRSFCNSTASLLPAPSKLPSSARRRDGAGQRGHPCEHAIRDEERRQRELRKREWSVRAETDTLKQALKIATSPKDAELDALTKKWRDASRTAAEEVFSITKHRVDAMGGISFWARSGKGQRDYRDESEAREEGLSPGNCEDGDGSTTEESEKRLMTQDECREARAEAKRERQRQVQQEAAIEDDASGEAREAAMSRLINRADFNNADYAERPKYRSKDTRMG